MNFNTGYGPGELTDKTRYKKKVFLNRKNGQCGCKSKHEALIQQHNFQQAFDRRIAFLYGLYFFAEYCRDNKQLQNKKDTNQQNDSQYDAHLIPLSLAILKPSRQFPGIGQ